MKTLLFAFLLLIPAAQALPQPQDKYINDFAGFLGAQDVRTLRAVFSGVEQNTTAEIVAVIVPAAGPLTPSQYRTELFDSWRIGKKGKDNGLLILYAVREGRIEVETGYGLEGILPDSKVGRILDDFYVPYRDKNQTAAGIVAASMEFSRVINENAGGHDSNTAVQDFFPYLFFLAPFALAVVFIALASRPPRCERCGQRMELCESGDGYDIYACRNGHKLKRKRRSGLFVVAGGFGGGGGGGFGGGGSGGGGAGR